MLDSNNAKDSYRFYDIYLYASWPLLIMNGIASQLAIIDPTS